MVVVAALKLGRRTHLAFNSSKIVRSSPVNLLYALEKTNQPRFSTVLPLSVAASSAKKDANAVLIAATALRTAAR